MDAPISVSLYCSLISNTVATAFFIRSHSLPYIRILSLVLACVADFFASEYCSLMAPPIGIPTQYSYTVRMFALHAQNIRQSVSTRSESLILRFFAFWRATQHPQWNIAVAFSHTRLRALLPANVLDTYQFTHKNGDCINLGFVQGIEDFSSLFFLP